MTYHPSENRYTLTPYNRCGKSGLKLPAISLGLWHNFGFVDDFDRQKKIIFRAFDLGITHFDLANNYGPPPGAAELNFGKILKYDLYAHRDELIISTKAGYTMWPGPYGDWGSRKYLTASLDQSLKRLGLDYVDIFYHHRPDTETPMEESLATLDSSVRNGKALYAGVSNYSADQTRRAARIMRSLGTPLLIHQPKYSMFERWVENGLLDVLEEEGMGCIPFSPLAQGLLTNKYLSGVPDQSRAAKIHGFLKESDVTADKINRVRKLNEIAAQRGQSMAQLALSWILKDPRITTVLIGASNVNQLEDCHAAVAAAKLESGELIKIEQVLSE